VRDKKSKNVTSCLFLSLPIFPHLIAARPCVGGVLQAKSRRDILLHLHLTSCVVNRKSLEKAVGKRLEGRDSAWFDLAPDDDSPTKSPHVLHTNKTGGGKVGKRSRDKSSRDKSVTQKHSKRTRRSKSSSASPSSLSNSSAAIQTGPMLPLAPLRGGAGSTEYVERGA